MAAMRGVPACSIGVRVDLVRAGAVDGEEAEPLLVDVGVGLRLRRVAARRVCELRDVRARRSCRER